MKVINAHLLEGKSTIKFILADAAVVFFYASQQHRDLKCHGLSYEDDYMGNAVAGLVTGGGVEIRFHRDYPDGRIQELWQRVLSSPELAGWKPGRLTYQGREIPQA